LATCRELKAQIVELEEQAAAARSDEFQEVLEDIRAKVAIYGFTERDVFGRGRPRRGDGGWGAAPAKCRDPKTGATWSGRGRAPNWIKDVRNLDQFLIPS
jgi:DNA-binding protein H-NS